MTPEPQRFRKKPVEVKAWQFKSHDDPPPGICYCGDRRAHVHTIHDNQRVDVENGDWILPEPDGEHFYPVKPDIFANTYEPIAEVIPMTHGTQAPETPGERAATHAPKTELPKMTVSHQWAVERAADTQLTLGFPAIHGYCYEASLIVRALVSGEAKLVPTAEIEAVLEVLGRTEVLDTNNATRKAALAIGICRWLTPEDER